MWCCPECALQSQCSRWCPGRCRGWWRCPCRDTEPWGTFWDSASYSQVVAPVNDEDREQHLFELNFFFTWIMFLWWQTQYQSKRNTHNSNSLKGEYCRSKEERIVNASSHQWEVDRVWDILTMESIEQYKANISYYLFISQLFFCLFKTVKISDNMIW